jgi:hypothetical protein
VGTGVEIYGLNDKRSMGRFGSKDPFRFVEVLIDRNYPSSLIFNNVDGRPRGVYTQPKKNSITLKNVHTSTYMEPG